MLVCGAIGLGRRACAIVSGAVVAACVAWGLFPAVASAARHYEMVSPLDKGQGDIVGDGLTTVAARQGDAVAFASRTPFGDTIGSGQAGQSQFVARRTDTGWVTRAITPTPRPDAVQTFFAPTLLQIYSEDLRTAIVWAYDLPAATDDAPLRNNIYAEDTDTRELETVTVSQVDPPTVLDFRGIKTWGISADARHVSFVTPTQFLPEAEPGVPNVYQWDDGVLSLAGVLPNGSVVGSNIDPVEYRNVMSADGTRLVFTVPSSTYGPSQLFMRIDGTSTAWISQPELTDDPGVPGDPNESNPSRATLQGVTPDGRTVFFTTDAGLVDSDTNGTTDLYRYVDSADPAADRDNLTMITTDGAMDGGLVVGMSDDGRRVYYQTTGSKLAVWDDGATHVISQIVHIGGNSEEQLGVMTGRPGYARVTPDGRYLAFAYFPLPAVDDLGNEPNGHRLMYLFSLDDQRLVCVSCPSSGFVTSDASVRPAVTSGNPQPLNVGFRPHFLSDGGQVFFSTADALAAHDRNGVDDVYEYDPATDSLNLLSTGKGRDPANFADASASGNDVFILTRQRLVGQDTDDLVDVYDVREGSLLPAPAEELPRPCQGEACQPPPTATPIEDSLGSLFFEENDAGTSRPGGLVVRQRIAVRGAAGILRVRLTAPGTLRWSGRGLRAGSARRGRGGTFEVALRLGRRARTQLKAAGVYRTSVRLTFASAGGEVERTTRVTFRAVAKKGR